MSRYIRQAGSSGGGTYGDSNVCALLPSYTGALSASDGTNICCIRNQWELICECNCIDTCYGTCVEFTFPSTADADNCKFSEYKLEVNGLYMKDNTAVQLFMKIGSSDCYCGCCSGLFRMGCNTSCTGGYYTALCMHCIQLASGASCWQGGNFVGCFARWPFFPGCAPCEGFGICFSTCSWTQSFDVSTNGWENCKCRTCWESFCKVQLLYSNNCPVCHCGSFRIYGKRLRPSAYSGYTQS